jgi:cell division protease FtsH
VSLLTEHRDTLERIAGALRVHETLDAGQLRAILEETGALASVAA